MKQVDLPDRYTMKRDVATITELWTEWTDEDGGPAMSVLEAANQKNWRNWSKTESSFFSRRRAIWEYIEDQVSLHSVATVTVANAVEEFQKAKKSQ